ncbi:MAG TPA: DUF2911 domain-containing protein [Chryseolinea sp.]
MRSLSTILTFCLFIPVAAICQQGDPSADTHRHDSTSRVKESATPKKSIAQEAHEQIGNAHIMIFYTAPAVRDRIIWGGLVPYGEVWVTGAHAATSIEFSEDLKINGKLIAAGKYAFFTIPGKEKWTIILNKNWDQHLTDEYDPADDVVRLETAPEPLPTVQERLQYKIIPLADTKGLITISWEKIKVTLPFELE